MSPPENPDSNGNAQLCWSQQFLPNDWLSAIQHGDEGKHGGVVSQLFKALAELSLQPSVAMPDGKHVMANQADTSDQGEAAANPKLMAKAPQDLTDGLGMSTDADNSAGIEPHLWLHQSGDLKQVVCGWIKKQEADGCKDPNQGNHPGYTLQIPETNPVVAMGKEVADHDHRARNACGGKDQAPGSRPNFCFCLASNGGPAAVDNREKHQQAQHHKAAVVDTIRGQLIHTRFRT